MRTLLTDQNITYEEVNAGPRENWVENWKPKMVSIKKMTLDFLKSVFVHAV